VEIKSEGLPEGKIVAIYRLGDFLNLPKHQENQENLVEVVGCGTFHMHADL